MQTPTHYADQYTLDTLLAQLAAAEMGPHRWGTDNPINGLRGVLADVMDEMERHREAALLRTQGTHVIVTPEGIAPGRFTDTHIRNAHNVVSYLMRRMTGGAYNETHGFGFTTDDFNNPLTTLDTEMRSDEMHVSELANRLADYIDGDFSDNIGQWATVQEQNAISQSQWTQLDRMLDNLRNAPFEEDNPDYYPEQYPNTDDEPQQYARHSPTHYGDVEDLHRAMLHNPWAADVHLMLADANMEADNEPEALFRQQVGRWLPERLGADPIVDTSNDGTFAFGPYGWQDQPFSRLTTTPNHDGVFQWMPRASAYPQAALRWSLYSTEPFAFPEQVGDRLSIPHDVVRNSERFRQYLAAYPQLDPNVFTGGVLNPGERAYLGMNHNTEHWDTAPITEDIDPAIWPQIEAILRERQRRGQRFADDQSPTAYGDREALEAVIRANPLEATPHMMLSDWFRERDYPNTREGQFPNEQEADFRGLVGNSVERRLAHPWEMPLLGQDIPDFDRAWYLQQPNPHGPLDQFLQPVRSVGSPGWNLHPGVFAHRPYNFSWLLRDNDRFPADTGEEFPYMSAWSIARQMGNYPGTVRNPDAPYADSSLSDAERIYAGIDDLNGISQNPALWALVEQIMRQQHSRGLRFEDDEDPTEYATPSVDPLDDWHGLNDDLDADGYPAGSPPAPVPVVRKAKGSPPTKPGKGPKSETAQEARDREAYEYLLSLDREARRQRPTGSEPATPGASPATPGASPATPVVPAKPAGFEERALDWLDSPLDPEFTDDSGAPGASPATPGASPATPVVPPLDPEFTDDSGAPGASPATPGASPATPVVPPLDPEFTDDSGAPWSDYDYYKHLSTKGLQDTGPIAVEADRRLKAATTPANVPQGGGEPHWTDASGYHPSWAPGAGKPPVAKNQHNIQPGAWDWAKFWKNSGDSPDSRRRAKPVVPPLDPEPTDDSGAPVAPAAPATPPVAPTGKGRYKVKGIDTTGNEIEREFEADDEEHALRQMKDEGHFTTGDPRRVSGGRSFVERAKALFGYAAHTQPTHYSDQYTLDILLRQLAHPDLNMHRWGTDSAIQGLRGILADVMDDMGRGREAELLRTQGAHVIITPEGVQPGWFNPDEVNRTLNNISMFLEEAGMGDAYDNVGSMWRELRDYDTQILPHTLREQMAEWLAAVISFEGPEYVDSFLLEMGQDPVDWAGLSSEAASQIIAAPYPEEVDPTYGQPPLPPLTWTESSDMDELPEWDAPTNYAAHTQPTHYADQYTVDTLLAQLGEADYGPHRWGRDNPISGLRGILADAMDDMERHREAALLREPGQHVMVTPQGIAPGRWNLDAVLAGAIADHAYEHDDPVTSMNWAMMSDAAFSGEDMSHHHIQSGDLGFNRDIFPEPWFEEDLTPPPPPPPPPQPLDSEFTDDSGVPYGRIDYGWDEDREAFLRNVHETPFDTFTQDVYADFLQDEWGEEHPDVRFRRDLSNVLGIRTRTPWEDKSERVDGRAFPFDPTVRGFSQGNIPREMVWQPPDRLFRVLETEMRPNFSTRRDDAGWNWEPWGSNWIDEPTFRWNWDRTPRDLPPEGREPDREWSRWISGRRGYEWPDRLAFSDERLWEQRLEAQRLTPAELGAYDFTSPEDIDPAIWPQVEALLRGNWDRHQQFADDEEPVEYVDGPPGEYPERVWNGRRWVNAPAVPAVPQGWDAVGVDTPDEPDEPEDELDESPWETAQNWHGGQFSGLYRIGNGADDRDSVDDAMGEVGRLLRARPNNLNLLGLYEYLTELESQLPPQDESVEYARFDYADFPTRMISDTPIMPRFWRRKRKGDYFGYEDDEDSVDYGHADGYRPNHAAFDAALIPDAGGMYDPSWVAQMGLELDPTHPASVGVGDSDGTTFHFRRTSSGEYVVHRVLKTGQPAGTALMGQVELQQWLEEMDSDALVPALNGQDFGGAPDFWKNQPLVDHLWRAFADDWDAAPNAPPPDSIRHLLTGSMPMNNRVLSISADDLLPWERGYGPQETTLDDGTAWEQTHLHVPTDLGRADDRLSWEYSRTDYADFPTRMISDMPIMPRFGRRKRKGDYFGYEDADARTDYDIWEDETLRGVPADTTPLWASADWFDENAQPGEATFRREAAAHLQDRLLAGWNGPPAVDHSGKIIDPDYQFRWPIIDPWVSGDGRWPAWTGNAVPTQSDASYRTKDSPFFWMTDYPNARIHLGDGHLANELGMDPESPEYQALVNSLRARYQGLRLPFIDQDGNLDSSPRHLTPAENAYGGITDLSRVSGDEWLEIINMMRARRAELGHFADGKSPTAYGDREALEAVIRANPLEATPHMMLSDWLREYDDPAEADFRGLVGNSVERRLANPWQEPFRDAGGYLTQPHPHGPLDPYLQEMRFGMSGNRWRVEPNKGRPSYLTQDWLWLLEGPLAGPVAEAPRADPDLEDVYEWGRTHPRSEVLPHERIYAGIDDLNGVSQNPALWALVEQIMRQQHSRGLRFEDDEAPTAYGDREALEAVIRDNPLQVTPHMMLSDYWQEHAPDSEEANVRRMLFEFVDRHQQGFEPEYGSYGAVLPPKGADRWLEPAFLGHLYPSFDPSSPGGLANLRLPEGVFLEPSIRMSENTQWRISADQPNVDAFTPTGVLQQIGFDPTRPDWAELLERARVNDAMWSHQLTPAQAAAAHTGPLTADLWAEVEAILRSRRQLGQRFEDEGAPTAYADARPGYGGKTPEDVYALLVMKGIDPNRAAAAVGINLSKTNHSDMEIPTNWNSGEQFDPTQELQGGMLEPNWDAGNKPARYGKATVPAGFEDRADFERYVLSLVRFGMNGPEIAKYLNTSPTLVKAIASAIPHRDRPGYIPGSSRAPGSGYKTEADQERQQTRREFVMPFDTTMLHGHDPRGAAEETGLWDEMKKVIDDGGTYDEAGDVIGQGHSSAHSKLHGLRLNKSRMTVDQLRRLIHEQENIPILPIQSISSHLSRYAGIRQGYYEQNPGGPLEQYGYTAIPQWEKYAGGMDGLVDPTFYPPNRRERFPVTYDPEGDGGAGTALSGDLAGGGPDRDYWRKRGTNYGTREELLTAIHADPLNATGHGVLADFEDEFGDPTDATYHREVMNALQRRLSNTWYAPGTNRDGFLHQSMWTGPDSDYEEHVRDNYTWGGPDPLSTWQDLVTMRPARSAPELDTDYATEDWGMPGVGEWIWDSTHLAHRSHPFVSPIFDGVPLLRHWQQARHRGEAPGVPTRLRMDREVHPHELSDAERWFAGIDNPGNLDPALWPYIEALMREKHNGGMRLANDDAPTDYSALPRNDHGQLSGVMQPIDEGAFLDGCFGPKQTNLHGTHYGDREALEAAVAAEPWDAIRHGILADWHDEFGSPQEAGFGRNVMESLDRRQRTPHAPPVRRLDGAGRYVPGSHAPELIPRVSLWHPEGPDHNPFMGPNPYVNSWLPAIVDPLHGLPEDWGWGYEDMSGRHVDSRRIRAALELGPDEDAGDFMGRTWVTNRTPGWDRYASGLYTPDSPYWLNPAERATFGIDNLMNSDPALWPQVEALMRRHHGRGQKFADDHTPTPYGDAEDERAFLGHIRSNPTDITAQLAFSDWMGDRVRTTDQEFQRQVADWAQGRLNWAPPATDFRGFLRQDGVALDNQYQQRVFQPNADPSDSRSGRMWTGVLEPNTGLFPLAADPVDWSRYWRWYLNNSEPRRDEQELAEFLRLPEGYLSETRDEHLLNSHGGRDLSDAERLMVGVDGLNDIDWDTGASGPLWDRVRGLLRNRFDKGQRLEGDERPSMYGRTDYGTVEDLLKMAQKKPADWQIRGVLADWLEEFTPQLVGPDTLEFLRQNRGKAWVHRADTERIQAGPHWTLPEIKAENKATGHHWFDRSTMRTFGTRINPRHVFSGPGGVYFPHMDDNFDRTRREPNLATFHPRTGSAGTWTTTHRGLDGRDFGSHEQLPGDYDEVVDIARQQAAGQGPFQKNRWWTDTEHGSAIEYPSEWIEEYADGEEPAMYGDREALEAARLEHAGRVLTPAERVVTGIDDPMNTSAYLWPHVEGLLRRRFNRGVRLESDSSSTHYSDSDEEFFESEMSLSDIPHRLSGTLEDLVASWEDESDSSNELYLERAVFERHGEDVEVFRWTDGVRDTGGWGFSPEEATAEAVEEARIRHVERDPTAAGVVSEAVPGAVQTGPGTWEYESHGRRVDIDAHRDGTVVVNFFNDDGDTSSAPSVRRGSLDLIRVLKNLAAGAALKGLPFGYGVPSDKRRARAYGEHLASLGYVPSGYHGGEIYWRPAPPGSGPEVVQDALQQYLQTVESSGGTERYQRSTEYGRAEDIAGFLQTLRADPEDTTSRAIFADYLEEYAPDAVVRPQLDIMRTFQGRGWVSQGNDDRWYVGPHTSPEEWLERLGHRNWFGIPVRDVAGLIEPESHREGPGGDFWTTQHLDGPESGSARNLWGVRPRNLEDWDTTDAIAFWDYGHPDENTLVPIDEMHRMGERRAAFVGLHPHHQLPTVDKERYSRADEPPTGYGIHRDMNSALRQYDPLFEAGRDPPSDPAAMEEARQLARIYGDVFRDEGKEGHAALIEHNLAHFGDIGTWGLGAMPHLGESDTWPWVNPHGYDGWDNITPPRGYTVGINVHAGTRPYEGWRGAPFELEEYPYYRGFHARFDDPGPASELIEQLLAEGADFAQGHNITEGDYGSAAPKNNWGYHLLREHAGLPPLHPKLRKYLTRNSRYSRDSSLTSADRSAYSSAPTRTEYAMPTNYADTQTVDILLQQLAAAEMGPHRWGHDIALQGIRGILADAMDDMERHREAALLRTEGRHVVITPEGVRPGRMTIQDILTQADDFHFGNSGHWTNHAFAEPMLLFPGDESGYRPEDFHDPEGYATPIPPNKFRMLYLDRNGGDYHHFADLTIEQLPGHLADMIDEAFNNYVEGFEEVDDYDPSEPERLLAELRAAPFEEEDQNAQW